MVINFAYDGFQELSDMEKKLQKTFQTSERVKSLCLPSRFSVKILKGWG
jgi:hypothetical protein